MEHNTSGHPPSSEHPFNHPKILRVLIVEDDGLSRYLLRMALENQGYECLEAENGLRGLEKLLVHRVDAVISDQQMPVMNGIDFIREMHARYAESAPPVILVSGNDGSHLHKLAEELGVSACFGKPYHLETLLHSVAKITKKPLAP